MFKSYYATSVVALLVMLSACSGSGGSDNPSGPGSEVTNIDFSLFRGDQGVSIDSDNASVILSESSEYSSIVLINDPGAGDDQAIFPASGKSLFFEYDFQQSANGQDEFGLFLVDVADGGSLGESAEFFVQEAGSGEGSINLSDYADIQVGVQFQLASLPGDQAPDSSVVIKNLRIK